MRLGLKFYDWISRRGALPKSRVHRLSDADCPSFCTKSYRWACSYSDAQVVFPERFVLSMLHDAQRAAEQAGVEFRVLTYCDVQREKDSLICRDREQELRIKPALLINATGPWGDKTLAQIDVGSRRLLRGTKGSHLVTHHAGLKAALGGSGGSIMIVGQNATLNGGSVQSDTEGTGNGGSIQANLTGGLNIGTGGQISANISGTGNAGTIIGGNGSIEVVFDKPIRGASPGQCAVFYAPDSDEVLGGGWIL